MIKVKDQNGNIIKGLYKAPNGVLIVDNDVEFNKYKQQKQSQEEVRQLKQEVAELKQLVQTLLREHNG